MLTFPRRHRRLRHFLRHPSASKTTSAQSVASRHHDPTFEKLMSSYKHYLRVTALLPLLPTPPPSSIPFLRKYPHIFYPSSLRLTPAASAAALLESSALSSLSHSALLRLLSLSPSRSLPLRSLLLARRPLGLPLHFPRSLPPQFRLRDNPRERGTHLLELSRQVIPQFAPAVDGWRNQLHRENPTADDSEIKFAFKQQFPPGMKLDKSFRRKLKEWQRLPYVGPYDPAPTPIIGGGWRAMEKRAVAIVHEFLSLTVEKMVEVEQISHFRKWFRIEMNMRDLFLDHPGMFYLSTRGNIHTVFLREAYDRGQMIEPNPVYEARRKMLELVMRGRRGMETVDSEEDEVGFANEIERSQQGRT